MASITVDIRYKLVHLAKALGSVRKAAYDCGVSLVTAYRWVKRYRETGACDSRPKPGRPRLLSGIACMEAQRLFLDEEGIADTVATALVTKGLAPHKVAKHTAIRAALSVGPMVPLTGSPHLILSEANMRKRVAFAQQHLNTNWDSYLFTDSKKFQHKHPGVKVSRTQWVRPGEQREAPKVSNVRQVHVYAGICKYGVTFSMEVTGTSGRKPLYFKPNGEKHTGVSLLEYREVLKQCLLPEGGRLFGSHGIRHWHLQQDGCPAHNSAAATVKEWNGAKHADVSLLTGWPGNSPDLNPIENVWSYIDWQVQRRGEGTFEAFKAAVREELANIPKRMLHNLVKSMGKRMKLVIEKGGQRIKY